MRGDELRMTIKRRGNRAAIRLIHATLVAAMLLFATTQAIAAETKPAGLNVIAHPVHQRAATGSAGNITAEWSKTSGVGVTWLTFDIGPLFERLTREATLAETTIDVAFLLNSQASPKVLSLLEPLDAYQAQNPIEDFPDIFKGMVDGVSHQGKLYAIPFRHAVSGLHYNEEFFKERGIAGPPSTIEEFTELAKKLTYTRADGAKVYGFVMTGNHYANIVDLARAWDGDFITTDYRLVVNQKGMVTAVKAMREMYEAGVYPRNFSALKSDDIDTWLQTGRAAMSIATISKTRNYNDPKNSKFPGKLKVTNLPVSKELKQKYTVAPAKIEYWSMAIPKNSKNKQLAWNLIRAMSSKANTLITALNGNGPARNSTYERPEFVQQVPWAAVEQRVLKVARIPLPPFDSAAQAGDILLDGQQASVLGMKTPQEAMDEVANRVKPLLP
jgi:multiple sugar transport system substrate-binding protein